MNSTSVCQENMNSDEEESFSNSNTSTEEEVNDIKEGDCLKNNDTDDFKMLNNDQAIACETTNNEILKSEKYLEECNEINVTLIVGRDCINLHLNEEMAVQDVIDIIVDMLGLLDNYLSLEMNGELVKPGMKLKLLAENNKIELKVVFCADDEVKSVLMKKESIEYTEGTLKEFKNTSTQTNARVQLWCRETQTPYFPLLDCSTNTVHTKAVQTNFYVSPKDKILPVHDYVPYDKLFAYQNEQAIKIQKCVRRFLAQRKIIRMKKERDIALLKKRLQAEEMSFTDLQDRIKDIMNKRPILLRDDFAKAHALLEDWLIKEKLKIIAEKNGKEKRVAMSKLFGKKMECLQYIQKCRMLTKIENENKFKLRLLDETSEQTLGSYKKGYDSIKESYISQKAEIFKKIYKDLRRRDSTQEERIKYLKTLKEFLENMRAPECTHEMDMLIEREIQMINMGLKTSLLEGSRKRLEELFLYLSTDPEFNPGFSNLQKQSENVTLFQCRTCKELKPPEKFNIDLLKGLTHCTVCTLRKELNRSNIILSPYKRMILQIYNDERNKGSDEGYVQLLQPTGLHYLVQRVWQGRSSLSEENEMELLRFIRWDKKYPWSPWNCILLTENEADLHQAIEDIDSFYGKHFVKKIKSKHMQAKLKFTDLEELNKRMKTDYNNISRYSSPQDTQLVFSIIDPKTKKLPRNCVLTESVSDLVFPHCNKF